jgi:hypothetical protein
LKAIFIFLTGIKKRGGDDFLPEKKKERRKDELGFNSYCVLFPVSYWSGLAHFDLQLVRKKNVHLYGMQGVVCNASCFLGHQFPTDLDEHTMYIF